MPFELTANAEDIVARHPELPDPFSVECKRPAHCAPDESEERVRRNLIALRRQLMKRDRRHVRMGVLGMDGVYGTSGQNVRAADATAISAMITSALSEGVADVRRMAADRNLRLESSMRVGALAFVGMGLDDRGAGYSIQCLRTFVLAGDRKLERALSGVLDKDR